MTTDAPLTDDELAPIWDAIGTYYTRDATERVNVAITSLLSARLDALHAENQRLERALTYGRAKEKQWRNRHDAARAERDALRDAIVQAIEARAESTPYDTEKDAAKRWAYFEAANIARGLSEAGERRE